VNLVREARKDDRTTAGRNLERASQAAELVFQHLGEEVFVPNLDSASGPLLADFLEQRGHSLTEKSGQTKHRRIAPEYPNQRVAIEFPAGVDDLRNDIIRSDHGHEALDSSRVPEQFFKLVRPERHHVPRPVAVFESPRDQQQLPNLSAGIPPVTGLEPVGRRETEPPFPGPQRMFADTRPAGHSAHGPHSLLIINGALQRGTVFFSVLNHKASARPANSRSAHAARPDRARA
jgi:hypothetical protein